MNFIEQYWLFFSLFLIIGTNLANCDGNDFRNVNPPLVISSSRLISNLIGKIPQLRPNPIPKKMMKGVMNEIYEECSLDAYILINQPGLTYADFKENNDHIFYHIQRKMKDDSTVVGFAQVEKVNEVFREGIELLKEKCDGKFIEINIYDQHDLLREENLPKYIDSQIRIFQVNLPKLYGNIENRKTMLAAHDRFIDRLMERFPTPYISILVSSLDTSVKDEIYKGATRVSQFKKLSKEFDPFDIITNDPRRLENQELFANVDFEKPKNRDNIKQGTKYEEFLQNIVNDERDIMFNNEFFNENRILVSAMLISFIIFVVGLIGLTVYKINSIFLTNLRSRNALKSKSLESKKHK